MRAADGGQTAAPNVWFFQGFAEEHTTELRLARRKVAAAAAAQGKLHPASPPGH